MKFTSIFKTAKMIKEMVNKPVNVNNSNAFGAESTDLKHLVKEAFEKIGHANILIAGKTGVGKSTLVNAVFQGNLADTSIGHPVTQTIKEYSKEGEPVHIFDTKGFELQNYKEIIKELKGEITRRKQMGDPKQMIHLVWFCISNEGKRLEDSEIDCINQLATEVPVVVVLTKCLDANLDFYDLIKAECTNATDVVRVLALQYETPIGTIPSFGLDRLIDSTYELVPDIAKAALAASQQVNESVTKRAVDKTIALAATSAAAIGATPIPFSDAVLLAPVQIGMISNICKIMKVKANRQFMTTLISSAAGVTGATVTGRAIVRGLIKFIPGAGVIIGGTISAATAGVLTSGMGYAFYNAVRLMQGKGADINAADLSKVFVEQLKKTDLF